MKKIISSLAVCALAICALTSCGDNNTDIVGKWSINDAAVLQGGIDEAGIIFSEDGKGSLYEVTSSMLHFTSGGLNVNGTVIGPEYISTSGDVLSVDMAGQTLLSMTRISYGDSQYDGKYTLDGGLMYDTMVAGMAKNNELDSNALNVTFEFDGNNSEIVFNDLFTYSVSGSRLNIDGNSVLLNTKGKGSAKFKVNGDTLTIKGTKTETLTRAE